MLPQVRAWYQNKQKFVGSFESEEEAARAYDRHILKLAGPTAHMQNARWGRWSDGVAVAGLAFALGSLRSVTECLCKVSFQAPVQLRFELGLSDPPTP